MSLKPYLEEDTGLLRINGRLDLAVSNYDSKKQILLPKEHKLTKLLILDLHARVGFVDSINFLINELRRRFWIIGVRRFIKTTLKNHCMHCRMRHPMPVETGAPPYLKKGSNRKPHS